LTDRIVSFRFVRAVDRRGTLVALVDRSAAGSLERAWVRIPDRSWLGIEPRATREAPWGWSDRLWHAAEPSSGEWRGTPLTVFEALDWTRIDRIPALGEPARLPRGGGTAVLNLIAELAAAQGAGPLAYRGPYPTEQLFLALLESFRYEPVSADPLAAFMRGGLVWTPAPAERVFSTDDLYVQVRERIEKVVWRGGAYYRPDWQGVARHSPRRIIDATDGVRCVLWALGQRLEDHLLLRPDGELATILTAEPPAAVSHPLPASVWSGVVAAVAARCAPPLAPFVESAAAAFSLEWGPVARDLAQIGHGRVRISDRLRQALAGRLAAATARADRAALGLAAIAEMAALVGDELRGRAQAEMLGLPPAAQPAALEGKRGPAARSRAERARDIAAAVDALVEEGAA
jgi:hypothetical protein